MKNYIVLILSTLFVAACNPVKGTLTVNQPMKLFIPEANDCNEEFDWWNCEKEESLVLRPGSYRLKLQFQSKKKVNLEVKVKKNKTKTVPIEMKNGQRFPEYHGSVSLKGKDIGQEFNIEGDVDSVVTESDTYTEYETCSKRVERRVCERVNDYKAVTFKREGKKARRGRGDRGDRGGKGRRRRVCEWKYVTEYGERHVEYYNRYTDTKVNLDFLSLDNTSQLASYQGSRYESDKIYTYKGPCILD